MSFQAMSWAIEEELPTKEKFVLLMLANYASNDKWDCYPSIAALSKDTGMSKATVMRALKSLESLGYLVVIRRMADGINLPNIYRLIKDRQVEGGSITQQPVVSHSNEGSITQIGGVVSQCDTNLSIKPINEPINNKINKKSSKGTRLPDDFIMPDKWIVIAKEIRPNLSDLQLGEIANSFIDYWQASNSDTAIKRSWLAAWRYWIRNQKPNQNNIKQPKKQEPDFDSTDWINGVGDLL